MLVSIKPTSKAFDIASECLSLFGRGDDCNVSLCAIDTNEKFKEGGFPPSRVLGSTLEFCVVEKPWG